MELQNRLDTYPDTICINPNHINNYDITSDELPFSLKNGDILYGFAYKFTSTKENLALSQTPTKGILWCSNRKTSYEKPDPELAKLNRPAYFIPFGKKENLLFSKAVGICSRSYAQTEENAWVGYYKELCKAIKIAQQITLDILENIDVNRF